MTNSQTKIGQILAALAIVMLLCLGFVAFHGKGTKGVGAGSMVSPESSTQALYGVESIGTGGTLYFGGTTNNANYNGSSVKMTVPRQTLATATTTICAIATPAATSSLEWFAVNETVSTTTASTITVYKGATPYANTTFLAGQNVAAGAQTTLMSSTTLDAFLLAPSQYIVIKQTGGTGTMSPTGTCSAEFVTLN